MRVLLVIVLTACGGSMTPAVTPKLSELPVETQRRDGVLDSSHVEPGPEQQPKTRKERKAETVAATAAAVIGSLMSTTSNVTIGIATSTDEGDVVTRPKRPRAGGDDAATDTGEARHEERHHAAQERRDEVRDATVPWVRLK